MKSKQSRCLVCSSADNSPFLALRNQPVQIGIVYKSREAAQHCPRGDLELALCGDCGFIWNLAFDPARLEYGKDYDNTLFHSSYFCAYARAEAQRLINRYDLRDKDLIVIGGGKGEFTRLLCTLGNNRAVMFDPSYDSEIDSKDASTNITYIPDYYSERDGSYKADLLVCRHVLEHIPDPLDFLNLVRRAHDTPDTVFYFVVPNILFNLRERAIWDFIYEHLSFFSPTSLAQAFTSSRFQVLDLYETFQGQFLAIEASPWAHDLNPGTYETPGQREALQGLQLLASAYSQDFQEKIKAWSREIESIAAEGKRAVVWGAGSKGVSFLNILNTQGKIQFAVDVNPHKQGKFVPGSGQEIVAPEFLRDYRPDMVITMNKNYQDEIIQILHELGLHPEVVNA